MFVAYSIYSGIIITHCSHSTNLEYLTCANSQIVNNLNMKEYGYPIFVKFFVKAHWPKEYKNGPKYR